MEHFQNDVNDKSIKVPGGLQRIITLDGYAIPIDITQGLPYINLRPYTDEEWETLPTVVMTSDVKWDPSVMDCNISDEDEWYDAIEELEKDPDCELFDMEGDYKGVYKV